MAVKGLGQLDQEYDGKYTRMGAQPYVEIQLTLGIYSQFV